MEKYTENPVNINIPFRILTGIAILLVVLGHLDLKVLTIGDLFPYYSFHVMVFLFVSGYFYKEESEDNVAAYVGRKAKHLLLPYFLWNLVYGLLVTVLHRLGFGFGSALSFKSLLVDPFLDGHQYMLNFASWFVPALFLVQLANILGRKLFRRLLPPDITEFLILAVTLILGMATVSLAIGGHVWGLWKLPGRILFMLPVYQMGIFYRKILEKYAGKVPDGIMLAAVALVQLLLVKTCNGLAFSAVWVTSFAGGPVIPYITTITGICFWYRIAKLLAKMPRARETLSYIGEASFSIMMHHVLGFFLVNTVCYLLYSVAGLFANFDLHRYRYTVDYVYLIGDNPLTKWIYLAAGLTISLILYKVEKKVKHLRQRQYNGF